MVRELGDSTPALMEMYCNNDAAMHISKNQVFHERTKHIEVDSHFVREKVVGTSRDLTSIEPVFLRSASQLADVLTKPPFDKKPMKEG